VVTEHYKTEQVILQYDPAKEVGLAYTWSRSKKQYEETNTPDNNSGLALDHYRNSDHWAATRLSGDYTTDWFQGVDYIGAYYGQITSDSPRYLNFDYGWGDQWDPTNSDTIEYFINHIPYPTGSFPDSFNSIDPTNPTKTTYFDETFPWVKDDDEGSRPLSLNLQGLACKEDDEDIGDYLTWDVTYSDGSTRPEWLGLDPITGILYGKPQVKHASELIQLKVTCTDQYGGKYSYFRSLLVNVKPQLRSGWNKFYTVNVTRNEEFSLDIGGEMLWDPDGDFLKYTMP